MQFNCGGTCPAICGCFFCNSMCCLSCSCAFQLQLVPVPALVFVRAVGCEQHMLLHLVLLLLLFLLDSFEWCFCIFVCCLSWSCAFKLLLLPVPAFGSVRALEHEQRLLFRLLLFLLLFLLKGC